MSILSLAKDSMTTQAVALTKIASQLGNEFQQAISLILKTPGRTVVCGMGKSGLIGQKMAATFASTGTPSFFMHPAEAFHGDLGMLTADDLLILISYSGETEEVIKLLPSLKHFGNNIIAIVGEPNSTLAKHANVALNVAVEREVCPNNLAPTTSTLTTMAMGDALAVVLIKERDFQASDFARYHPGGSLGKKLLVKVKDVMHQNNLPVVPPDESLKNTILVMTEGRLGLVVVEEQGVIQGIFTDGDLRRALVNNVDMENACISEVMIPAPRSISPECMLVEAEEFMINNKIKALLVVNNEKKLTGIVEIFDR